MFLGGQQTILSSPNEGQTGEDGCSCDEGNESGQMTPVYRPFGDAILDGLVFTVINIVLLIFDMFWYLLVWI